MFHGGNLMRIVLKIRLRGKRGYDISSVPFNKLEKANEHRKKRWELRDGWLIFGSILVPPGGSIFTCLAKFRKGIPKEKN